MNKIVLSLILVYVLAGCSSVVNNNTKSGEAMQNTNNTISGDSQTNESTEDDFIKKTVSSMTLEEKIEQMLILDYSFSAYSKEGEKDVTKLSDVAKDLIINHNYGGIILFADNVKGTEQTLKLINDFQQSATTNNKKHKIPLFMCVDQEGGRVTRLATGTSMPGNMALGAINNYDTTKEYASIIGEELDALGFNVDFAPVLDVNSNPSNPIIGVRSFSSDANRVAYMGKAFIEGLHSKEIISTLKHFPGHGDTATDSHTGLPLINKTYDDIKSLELIPFKAGIDEGADMIMTAHILYPQIEKTKYISKKTGEEITLPATLSKTILTDILRNDLGFEGLIVTDALNMSAIAEHYDKKDVAKYGINAGVDILLMPISLVSANGSVDDYVNMIADLVRNNEISEDRIDESVTRILKLKNKMKFFEDNSYELTEDRITNTLKTVGSKEHHDKEFKIAQDAITLVKGKDALPLSSNNKVLVLTAYSNEKNNIEYAFQLLKENNKLDDDFKYEIDNYQDKDFSEFKNVIKSYDVIIISGNTYNSNYFNNNNTKNGWQGRFIDEAIKEIHKQNKIVVYISSMLPYDAVRYKDADIIVCCYGDKAISNLPIEYNGETKTFGLNMSSAIIKLFSDDDYSATLPVDVYNIDKDYKYTDEVVYKVGE